MNDWIPIRVAAARLNRSERHVRRLITQGLLIAEGVPPHRMISVDSIEKIRTSGGHRPKNPDMPIEMSGETRYSGDVIVQSIPPLNQPDAAARRLGIAPTTLRRMIKSGDVPSVAIGKSKFVPGFWLRSVLGEALGVSPAKIEFLTARCIGTDSFLRPDAPTGQRSRRVRGGRG